MRVAHQQGTGSSGYRGGECREPVRARLRSDVPAETTDAMRNAAGRGNPAAFAWEGALRVSRTKDRRMLLEMAVGCGTYTTSLSSDALRNCGARRDRLKAELG